MRELTTLSQSETRVPACSVTGQPTLSAWFAGTALLHLRQVLLSLSTRAKHPALYLYTRSGKKQVCTYIPRSLHETVRQWVENGRRVKRLVDQVSQQNLQDLLERKQPLLRAKGRSPSEDHSP